MHAVVTAGDLKCKEVIAGNLQTPAREERNHLRVHHVCLSSDAVRGQFFMSRHAVGLFFMVLVTPGCCSLESCTRGGEKIPSLEP